MRRGWPSWAEVLTATMLVVLAPRDAAAVNAVEHRDQTWQRFQQVCPPEFVMWSVWGTDIYTDDSEICTAAVHAGAITHASGGVVTYEMRPGQSSYQGSTRNGITSLPYGSWPASYVIISGTGGTDGTDGTDGIPGSVCGLGDHWDVIDTDGAWRATWTRRGTSNVFDGHWTMPDQPDTFAVLTVTMDANGHVSVERVDEPNIFTVTDCHYDGQLQSDGVTVSGTVTCNSGVGVLGPFNWWATIQCDAGGA
ncbi:MAG: LCCL domain-containing protein [Myxococcota bacterium]